jgi:hypothetical protein
MHSEYVSASASRRCDELELEQPEGEQPAGSVALGEFADAAGDPPPHAANPSPKATRVAPSAARRQRRRPLLDV